MGHSFWNEFPLSSDCRLDVKSAKSGKHRSRLGSLMGSARPSAGCSTPFSIARHTISGIPGMAWTVETLKETVDAEILRAFVKKTEKTPAGEIELALQRAEELKR
jgi:hypothetical protein